MLKRIKTNPIEKEQEEILWDRFQEFRLDKNVEIYYIRAEIENLSFDLVRLDKEDKIKNDFLQNQVETLKNEITHLENAIEVLRINTRKKVLSLGRYSSKKSNNSSRNNSSYKKKRRVPTSGKRSKSIQASKVKR